MIKDGKYFVEVPKCGSRSITSALMSQGYQHDQVIREPHITTESAMILYGDKMTSAVLVVRDPIRRFYSLLNYSMRRNDEIEQLAAHRIKQQINPITWPQARFHKGDIEKHVFGSVNQACDFLGIGRLHYNASPSPLVTNTDYVDLIKEIYSEDFALWEEFKGDNKEW
jgi:hypothetical protein